MDEKGWRKDGRAMDEWMRLQVKWRGEKGTDRVKSMKEKQWMEE